MARHEDDSTSMRLDRIVLLLSVMVAPLIPIPMTAQAQEPEIVFEGHGWGHGVGLSQYGARAMAGAGNDAADILGHYFTDTSVVPMGQAVSGWLIDDPEPLWVNLTGTPYTSIQQVSFATAAGSLTFCQQEPASVGSMYQAKNETAYSPYVKLLEQRLANLGFNPGPADGWFDADTTSAVEAFQTSEGLTSDGVVGPNTKNALWPPDSGDRCVIATTLNGTAKTLKPNDDGTECTLDGAFAPGACIGSIRNLTVDKRVMIPERKIRNGTTSIQLAHGDVRIRPDRSDGTGSFEGLHVLVEIGVDDYLKGIEEIPFSWPLEALKAQAIASRSYGVGIARDRGPEPGFSGSRQDYCWCHLWSNTYSQVYAGYSTETISGGVWQTTVSATGSQVLKHPTAGLATAYYSSSSGGATEANEDAWGGSPVSYLRSVPDQWSLDPANPFADWSHGFAGSTVAAKVGLDELTGVGVVDTNTSGSAKTVRFVGVVNGVEASAEKSGDWVRTSFGLRSNYFDVAWGDVSNPPPPPPQQTANPTFADIAGSTFESDIEWLAAEGVTKGCNPPENTLFCPGDRVTRGQMAAFIKRFLDLPPASKDHFGDDNGSTFEDDINRLAEAGITRGCNPPDNTLFCPGQNVTRGQMAAFLVRALGLTANDHTGFGDVPASHTFHDDIGKLATAGITKGCNPPGNTLFCPSDYVTRGQMAAFLHRADQFR